MYLGDTRPSQITPTSSVAAPPQEAVAYPEQADRDLLAAAGAELEGEIPENPVEIEGSKLPVRKRGASTQLIQHQLKMPRVVNPNGFSGESLEELTVYNRVPKVTSHLGLYPTSTHHTTSLSIHSFISTYLF